MDKKMAFLSHLIPTTNSAAIGTSHWIWFCLKNFTLYKVALPTFKRQNSSLSFLLPLHVLHISFYLTVASVETFSSHRRTHFLSYLKVFQTEAQEEIKKKVNCR